MRLRLSIIVFLLVVIGGCESERKDWEAFGYQDGYAATINTACGFRATMIYGEFDKPEYAKGYSRGAQAGSAAVAQQGCENLR